MVGRGFKHIFIGLNIIRDGKEWKEKYVQIFWSQETWLCNEMSVTPFLFCWLVKNISNNLQFLALILSLVIVSTIEWLIMSTYLLVL